MRLLRPIVAIAITMLGLTAACGSPNQFAITDNKPVAPGGAQELPGGGVVGPKGDYAQASPPGPTCINGWAVPAEDNPLRDEIALALAQSVHATPTLDRIRVFTGPAAFGATANPTPVIFALVRASSPPAARGRWLLRGGSVQTLRVVASAPYDATGWGDQWRAVPAQAPSITLPSVLIGCFTGA